MICYVNALDGRNATDSHVNEMGAAPFSGICIFANTTTTKNHDLSEELLVSLLADYRKPKDLIGESGLLEQLTKRQVGKAT